ncbi:MAG: hypothetical protein KAU03_02710 [Candidatus Altiarchaeales archaeon]|nr:hypothetical protein [Candidatus Altiarchaeales archaeon]
MEIKHCCVSLLDVPEVLPFGFEPSSSENIMDLLEGTDHSEDKLLGFMSDLEREFGERIYRLGQDMVAEKLYRRYLLERDGFIEVAIEKPCAVIAHFTTMERGEKFANALANVVKKYVGGEIANLLCDDINISCQEQSELTQYKLQELRGLRNV